MSTPSRLVCGLLVAAVLALRLRRARARALATAMSEWRELHSRPGYYGSYLAIWTALPALIVLLVVGGRPAGRHPPLGRRARCRQSVQSLVAGRAVARHRQDQVRRARGCQGCRARSSRSSSARATALHLPMMRSASCRSAASRSARRPSPTSSPPPTTRSTTRPLASGSSPASPPALALLGFLIGLLRASARNCAPATRSNGVMLVGLVLVVNGRHPDDRRHRPVDAV